MLRALPAAMHYLPGVTAVFGMALRKILRLLKAVGTVLLYPAVSTLPVWDMSFLVVIVTVYLQAAFTMYLDAIRKF